MDKIAKTPLTFFLLLIVSVWALAACGSDPDPIVVYVTPTPQIEPTATATPAPVAENTTLASARQSTSTPEPTPPGAQFGPIVGPNYTPAPLYTPLPDMVSQTPCFLSVIAAQVTLYQSPDQASAPTGVAYSRDSLTVIQVSTDSAGNTWAQTDRGWLPVTDGGLINASLDSARSCQVMRGAIPDTTLLGLHVLNGTRDNEVLSFVRRLNDSGHPLGTLKGLNSAENLINEVEKISPQTVTVYRSLLSGDGFGDCPVDVREEPDPAATARRWMDGLGGYWSGVNADYYEVVNECPVSLNWITQFMIEVMKIANEDQRCLLLFSFPGGHPDMAEFDTVLPAYQYALDHPCQPGRTHGIALHAYSMQDGLMLSETDVWVGRRHEIIYAQLLNVLPDAVKLPFYLTEVGIGGGQSFPGCDVVIRDAILYTHQVETAPYVNGFHLWSVGTGTQWYDIADCLPALADALIRYYGG